MYKQKEHSNLKDMTFIVGCYYKYLQAIILVKLTSEWWIPVELDNKWIKSNKIVWYGMVSLKPYGIDIYNSKMNMQVN